MPVGSTAEGETELSKDETNTDLNSSGKEYGSLRTGIVGLAYREAKVFISCLFSCQRVLGAIQQMISAIPTPGRINRSH